MKTKGIYSFAAGAGVYRKEGHHRVKGKGVGEEVLVTGVEVSAWNGRGIEG